MPCKRVQPFTVSTFPIPATPVASSTRILAILSPFSLQMLIPCSVSTFHLTPNTHSFLLSTMSPAILPWSMPEPLSVALPADLRPSPTPRSFSLLNLLGSPPGPSPSPPPSTNQAVTTAINPFSPSALLSQSSPSTSEPLASSPHTQLFSYFNHVRMRFFPTAFRRSFV